MVNGNGMLDRFRLRWGGGALAVAREAIQGDPTYVGAYGNPYEDRAFRRVSGVADPYRELRPGEWQALDREVWDAYTTNPLAYAVIELGTDFVVGSGVHVKSSDPRLQRMIDSFWQDPDNSYEINAPLLYTELSLHGELFVRFYRDDLTGRVVCRSIDPLRVISIERDPEDMQRVVSYRVSRGSVGLGGAVIAGSLGSEDVVPASEMLAWRVNGLSYSLRGRSDLATLLPWLRRYKDWLTDRVRINRNKGAFLYDVTLDGATPQELQAKRAEYAAPPEPGTVIFHNQGEHWGAVHPGIGADDVSADGRAMRLMVAVGARVPEHFLSEGATTNRATAVEMGPPAIRHFRRRQELFRSVVGAIVRKAVVSRNQVLGVLGPRQLERGLVGMAVEFDELQEVDRRAAGQMATMFTNALAVAMDRGWIDGEQGRELFFKFLGEELGEVAKVEERPGVAS